MLDKTQIYLDINSSAPLHPRVKSALGVLLQEVQPLANPSSIHLHGRLSKKRISEAKESIISSLGSNLDPNQLLFTSSGSEANQQIIHSVFKDRPGAHWITSPVEHHSVLEMVEVLKQKGVTVDFVDIDENGLPLLDSLQSLIKENTALVSLVWVNNETGAISDIQKISNFLKDKKIPLHVDAAQAWGKIPLCLDQLNVAYLSLSAHKIGALAGTGVIYHAPLFPLYPLIYGHQEKARRGGTENLIGITALGIAAESIDLRKWDEVQLLKVKLEEKLKLIPGVTINAENAPRVAGTTNLTISGIEGDGLVMALDLEGYSVSAGSACSSGVLEPSHVLTAMGKSKQEAQSSIRISFDESIRWENLEEFVKSLTQIVQRIKGIKNRYESESTEKPQRY